MEKLAPTWPTAWPLPLFLTFASFCLAVYWPALGGELISDDRAYITENPYTGSLDGASVVALVEPYGDANAFTANYAPVHLLLHALQRQAFGEAVVGYHLTNVLLHALNATLLVVLLLASRVPTAAALVGGGVFAFHPANVEAVAWISQLKSLAAMALALVALLLLRRWPVASTLPFALALLAKASATFALPFAAALVWARGGPNRRHAVGLALWALVFAVYLPLQLAAHGAGTTGVQTDAYADLGVQLRSMAAYGARYLVMAATSYGVSPFQQPDPAVSLLDPWWLAALLLGALVAWRMVATLRARSEEGAWWLAAAAAFGPISQWLPFQSAVADRYLYFILPGLIGGVLLALAEVGPRIAGGHARGVRIGAVAALCLLLFFGVRSHDRAALWQHEERLLAEGARSYPDSMYALHLAGLRSTRRGDVDAAIAALRRSIRRGMDPRKIWSDGRLASLRASPAFAELVRVELERWLDERRRLGWSTRPQLAGMARVELALGRPDNAIALLERALAADGPFEAPVRAELEALRASGGKGPVLP